MLGMEKQRLSGVIRQYEAAVEEDVIQAAGEMGIPGGRMQCEDRGQGGQSGLWHHPHHPPEL